jgi:hypothetical protein
MNIKALILYFFVIFLSQSCKNIDKQAVEPKSTDNRLYIFEDPEQFSQTQYYVWLPTVRVRKDPDKNAEIVAKLKKGDQLEYLGIKTIKKDVVVINNKSFEDNWIKVKTTDGIQGWVFGAGINIKDVKDDLSPTPYDDCFLLIADREINDFAKCVGQVRKQILKEQSKKCSVNLNGLSLILTNGRSVNLANNTSTTNKTEFNYLMYNQDVKQFIVQVQYSNMEEFMLIDATNGNKINTWGFPKFSPGKNFIVSSSSNFVYNSAPNGIQIFSLEGNVIKKLWEREIENYEPYCPKWLDNNTIGVTLKPKGSEKKLGSKFALIRKVSNTDWKMEY